MNMNIINISKDFSDTPGGRYKKEGMYSGEEFRDTILLQAYEKIENTPDKLTINFDNCFGFATSFLEEAFGGLVRVHHKRDTYKKYNIISNDDETIPELIEKYISEAEKKLR